MVNSIGVDIEEVKRFKNTKNHFLNLIFTKREIKYCKSKKKPYISFAGKFCAKEAVIKAYSKKIPIKDIEVVNLKSDKLEVRIRGKPAKRINCSISHTNNYAIAFVVIN